MGLGLLFPLPLGSNRVFLGTLCHRHSSIFRWAPRTGSGILLLFAMKLPFKKGVHNPQKHQRSTSTTQFGSCFALRLKFFVLVTSWLHGVEVAKKSSETTSCQMSPGHFGGTYRGLPRFDPPKNLRVESSLSESRRKGVDGKYGKGYLPGAPKTMKNKGFHLQKIWFLGTKNKVFDGCGCPRYLWF